MSADSFLPPTNLEEHRAETETRLPDGLAPRQAELIRAAVDEAQADPNVVGIMLQGSLARGDGHPGSDVDLFLLLRDGCPHSFLSEERKGILVEQHFFDRERATTKLRGNPMLAYGYLDGRILRDDTGGFESLRCEARAIVDAYRTQPGEREGIFYWLQSTRIKIKAARDAGDLLKASFVTATNSWKIVEGIWAVNDLPVPPSGTVLSRRGDLKSVPDGWDAMFERLFLGDTRERIDAALAMIDFLLRGVPSVCVPPVNGVG